MFLRKGDRAFAQRKGKDTERVGGGVKGGK